MVSALVTLPDQFWAQTTIFMKDLSLILRDT